jgi:hypothetical protein
LIGICSNASTTVLRTTALLALTSDGRPMLTDHFAGEHSTRSAEAVQAFEGAVHCLAMHRSVAAALHDALSRDSRFVAAHALGGICAVLTGRAAGMAEAAAHLKSSEASLSDGGGGTSGERALVRALAYSAAGHLGRAAAVLEQHAETHPHDFLAIKLAHSLRFMTGAPRRMLVTVSSALKHWTANRAGYGYLLGCKAFALEETGDLAAAERASRTAIELQPDDVWGLHALAHVLEMSGRTREGCHLLEARLRKDEDPQGFGRHLVWHLALFHLAQGGEADALALFDDKMLPVADGDFRDMANAVSLLWRLEQHGVNVGPRWQMVGEVAARHSDDCTYVFASLHDLLTLLRAGRHRAAADLMAKMKMAAAIDDTDQARVAGRVGVAVARAISAATSGKPARSALTALAARLIQLGGSHTQRDLFLLTLMANAADSCDAGSFRALADIRSEFRHSADRLQSSLAQRLHSRRSRWVQGPSSATVLAGGPFPS